MVLEQLSHIEFTEEGIRELCSLGPPDPEVVQGRPEAMAGVLDSLFDVWRELVRADVPFPIETCECRHSGGQIRVYEGDEVRGRAVLAASAYFDVVVRAYLGSSGPEKSVRLPIAMTLKGLQKILPAGEKAEGLPFGGSLALLAHEYLSAMWVLHFIDAMRACPFMPRGLLSSGEALAHKWLANLASYSFEFGSGIEGAIGRWLTRGAMTYATVVYREVEWNRDHRMGPFSAMRLDELSPLARRESSVLARYGAKRVEKVFEQQLALVFQSFGLHVVSTRTGQKTVDLVCIADESSERVTFLVEAKTSKAAYALPSRDARALRDYVADVKKSLCGLPPLGFVLVVGGDHSRTLDRKLHELEADIGVPARFMTAHQLADMRERVTGSLPMDLFKRVLLAGKSVADEELVDQVVSCYQDVETTYTDFVSSMMRARGATRRNSGSGTREDAAPEFGDRY